MNFNNCFLIICLSSMLWNCTENDSNGNNSSKNAGLKIMTYNIHHANPPSRSDVIDVEAIAEVIRQQNPDFVALQEVDVFTKRSGKELHEARDLADKLDMYYYFAKALDYQGGYYGNAVLSKFPIQDSIRISLPALPGVNAEDRVWAGIKVEADGKDLWFGSTHLDYKTEENNLYQSQTLISALDKFTIPVIIGGDFNVTESSQTIALFDKQFQRTCTEDCPPTIPVTNPTRQIDFLMSRPKDYFHVESHQVIDEQYASDHRPVIAVIQF